MEIEVVICPPTHSVNPDPHFVRRQADSPAGRTSHTRKDISVLEVLWKILGWVSPQKPFLPPTNQASGKLYALDKTDPLANKRAVLCGVSCKRWKHRLKGTVNDDVLNMKDLLINYYKFAEENILVLTEKQTDDRLIPTRANIKNCLKWLVKECRSGDSLVFYFSGHGLRQTDFSHNERDGFYATIVKRVPESVTLHVIVDACHSGTILDLGHVYDKEKEKWTDNKPPSGARKQTSGGKAYSICACEDGQAFSSKKINGAVTAGLLEIVREKGVTLLTYGELLDKIHKRIEQANQQGCVGGSTVLSRIFGPNFTLKPLLSASEEFPVYQTQFKL